MAKRGDAMFGRIAVDWRDMKDFQRAVRHAADEELPKRVGQANKETGEFIKRKVDQKSDPAAVGAGRGADVRPSSSKREVLLRVGGSHRSGQVPIAPWGVRRGGNPTSAPPRPYIRRIVEDHREEIVEKWKDAIEQAVGPAFAKVDI